MISWLGTYLSCVISLITINTEHSKAFLIRSKVNFSHKQSFLGLFTFVVGCGGTKWSWSFGVDLVASIMTSIVYKASFVIISIATVAS